jgi:hypothetical protein
MLDYIQAVEISDTKILLGENISGFPYGTTNAVWSIRCIRGAERLTNEKRRLGAVPGHAGTIIRTGSQSSD